ncbi:hypothetical protein ADL22_12590 [Streptomyces sp. NRRL F-4489]|uniref:hypothetical protein n=1 Tax=Streptomyces sp. NRRL F-4489 TaxID=1609095 RepID=UPI0007480CD0|nr:hypothetical protein [Streptomyces sp. NRRL F-4489]KUL44774.1 hypothetical protein ADL22_12590 [Streptomyces sp. NRRL F-4489]
MLIMAFGAAVSHLSSEQVVEEVGRWNYGEGEIISDQCAQTIASWFQSSGTSGIRFAALSTSGKVPLALVDDCESEIDRHIAENCSGVEAADTDVCEEAFGYACPGRG